MQSGKINIASNKQNAIARQNSDFTKIEFPIPFQEGIQPSIFTKAEINGEIIGGIRIQNIDNIGFEIAIEEIISKGDIIPDQIERINIAKGIAWIAIQE